MDGDCEMEVFKLSNRVCDLCDQTVTSEDHRVTRSFVLTDWGVICVRCWDDRIKHHSEFDIVKVYLLTQRVDDEWITQPLVFASPDSD